jgi:hypothetical protein
MPPLTDSDFCWSHDPRHAEEAAAARTAGGQVKRNEGRLRLIYDLVGVETVPDIRRWIELALFETLRLDNGVVRNRVILSGAQVAAKLLETGELAERVDALEAVVNRQGHGPDPFASADSQDDEAAG